MEKLLNMNERTRTFTIDEEINGESYKGEFVAKFPSIIDNLNIEKISSRYLEGSNPDTLAAGIFDIAFMMATCDVLITEKPEWFDYNQLADAEVIRFVFDEVKEYVDSFRNPDGKDSDTEDGDESDNKETLED